MVAKAPDPLDSYMPKLNVLAVGELILVKKFRNEVKHT